MNRTNTITISILLLIVLAIALYAFFVNPERFGFAPPEPSAAQVALESSGTAPYTDINGTPVSLEDYFGRVLVVHAWASWCPDCAITLPLLAGVTSQYPDEDVVVLAINRAEPQTTAVAFLKSINATDGVTLLLDPEDRFYERSAGFSMPETVVYDRSGNVVAHLRGRITAEQATRAIDKALAESEE